jgi:hypothetical protein
MENITAPKEPPWSIQCQVRTNLLELTRNHDAHGHRTPLSEVVGCDTERRKKYKAASNAHTKPLRQQNLIEVV